MKSKDEIAIVVQARLNSTRCPRKMVRSFDKNQGLCLFEIACQKLEKINLPKEQKFVSICEGELVDIANKYDISIYHRSVESANADEGAKLIWEWCEHLPQKYYVMFSACLPFLKEETINEFVETFTKSEKEVAFAVNPLRDYVWNQQGDLVVPSKPPESGIMNTKSQQLVNDQMFIAGHALYAGTMKSLCENTQLADFTGKTIEFVVIDDEAQMMDIDTEDQFQVAKTLWGMR